MKYFLTAGWAVVCIVVLFFGHSYWKERTAVNASGKNSLIDEAPAAAETASPKTAAADDASLLNWASNWPVSAQQQLKQSLKAKKPFTILFVGSDADQAASQKVSAKLETTFGKENLAAAVQSSDLTSTDFVAEKKQLEIATEKAQLIILEPFVLNDNGKVATKDSIANLEKIIKDVKEVNPNTTFILEPSFPLFQAKFYPLQVDALKTFAKQNGYTYLDHWKAWPEYTKEELKNYLLADQSAPNDKGYKLWAKYLEDYLISK